MFTHVLLTLLNAATCLGSAAFQMFPGFGTASLVLVPMEAQHELHNYMPVEDTDEDISQGPHLPVFSYVHTDAIVTTTEIPFAVTNTSTTTTTTTEAVPPSFDCPEDEKPSNIGPYEVPTEKDLVRQVKKALHKRFRRYNKKTLILLKHIKEATKSAKLQVQKCRGKKSHYNMCLKEVNRRVTTATKDLMTMVEDHKRNISFFIKGKICNMAAMKPSPLMLVKKLAVEEASLKFAMPAFLRLLNECHKVHCKGDFSNTTAQKPRRRMGDSEFLVKHYLTNNSLQLINDLK